jgi:dUTP pyrophosphatase
MEQDKTIYVASLDEEKVEEAMLNWNLGTSVKVVDGALDAPLPIGKWAKDACKGNTDFGNLSGPVSSRRKLSSRILDGLIKCKLLTPGAKLPTKGSVNAAGFDLCSLVQVILYPGCRSCIPTGISLSIPPGYYGRVAPRSGLAVKNGIDVLAGVCDADFRGEINVVLINHGEDVAHFLPGDRIAQLIIEKCGFWEFEEVEELDDTARGAGGFGSTGV